MQSEDGHRGRCHEQWQGYSCSQWRPCGEQWQDTPASPPSQRGIRWGVTAPLPTCSYKERPWASIEARWWKPDFHWLRMRCVLPFTCWSGNRGSQLKQRVWIRFSLKAQNLKYAGFHQKSLIIPRSRKTTNWKRQSTDANNTKLTEMLELSDKDVNAAIIKCFNKQLWTYLKVMKKVESQQRNRNTH